jgi:hypothetical protein
VECEVVVEKILKVGEGFSLMKTFFVIKGYKTMALVLPLLMYFYSPQILIK